MFGAHFLQRALLALPILIFSLTVHEFFHAWTALRFGDTTARDMGRLTLNPLAHLDLWGTIVMVVSGFRFGWAKPVPVNPFNLRNPRKADIWVSFAGPLSNIGLAVIAAFLYRMDLSQTFGISPKLGDFLTYAVQINCILAFFNMIPLFPLDGSHILRHLLPPKYDHHFDNLDRFAPFILLLLIITNWLWIVLGPIVYPVIGLLLGY